MKPRATVFFRLAVSSTLISATADIAYSQTIYDWKDTAPDGNWTQGAAGARWWDNTASNDLWDIPTPGGVLRFNNNAQLTMTNNAAGTYNVSGFIFGSSNTSVRTLDGNAVRFYDFSGNDPYITNDSSATHIINLNIEGDGDSGDPLNININGTGGLTFGGTINNQGSAINVGGTATSAATVTFNGIVSGAGGLYKSNANTTLLLNAVNTYTGDTTISGGTLEIGGTGQLNSGTYAGAIANSGTLKFNSTANQTLSGTLSGTGSLVKSNTGTLALSTQKTYTGGTTINGGILDLTGGGGVSGTIRGTVTVNSGGTLRLSTGDATGYGTGSDRLSIININGGTLHVNTTGNQTVSNAAITLTGGTISGIAGSNIDLFNNGTSVTTLASATQSTISIPSMNLRQNDTVFNIADGAAAQDLAISSAIGNGSAGNHNMIKAGAGTMALSGASSFTGSTSIRDGVVILTGGNNRLPTSATVILGNSTTSGKLVLDGTSQTLASLTTSGTGTTNALVGGSATASTLTVNNSSDIAYAGKLGGAGTNENNFALSKNSAGNLTLSGTNTYTGTTTLSGGTLTISGSTNTSAGTIAFNGGTLQIASGGAFATTGTGSPSGTGGGYNVNAGGTLTVGALNFSYALGTQTVDGTLNVTGDFTTSWAATKALAGTGTINAGGYKSKNFSILNINTPLTLNVSGQVNLGDNSGQNGDINQSAGTVNFNTSTAGGIRIAHWSGETSNYNLSGGTLNAKNSYFGVGWDGVGVFRVSGTGVANLKELKLGANSNNANMFYLGDAFAGNSGGRVNLGANGISKQSVSTINLGNGTIGAYADWSSSANMTLASTTSFNTLDSVDNTTGRTITLSGVLSGAGALTKTGAGTLKITTRGTYTGATVVNEGILELATPNYGRALTTSGITVNPGATLNINGTNILYDAGSPNVYVPVTVNSGTVALISTAGGSHNHFGALSLNAGTVWGKSTSPYSNQYSSLDADITVGGTATSTIKGDSTSFHFGLVNNPTFTVASTGDVSGVDLLISANLGDAGGIIKAGAGVMKLTGNNTYTGNTTINSGTLQVTGASAYLYNGGFTNTPVITVNTGGALKLDSFAYGAAGGTGQLSDYRQRRILNGGTFEVTGGTHSSGNNFTVNVTTGGTFRYNPAVTTDTLTLNGNGNTDIQVDGPLTFDAVGNIAVSENMTGSGSLAKTGAQTLTLSGSNSYSGDTTVSAGTIRVNGTNSGTGTFNVASGATLGGTGGIAGAVNVSGVLSPGASIQSLATGSLSMVGGSSLEYELQDASSTGADLVDITGDFSLSGLVTLNLQKIGTGSWSISDKLTLLSYTGSWNSGLFTYAGNTVADDTNFTFDGQLWTLNYDDTSAGTNFSSEASGAFVTMTAIPEPRAALIGGIGLLALLRRRRVS